MYRQVLKLLIILFAIGVLFVSLAQAAQSDSVTVTVTVTPSISVEIQETDLSLGSVAAGGILLSATAVTVRNTGSGIKETYSLSLTDPVDPTTGAKTWEAVQDEAARIAEKYILNAAFDSDGAGTIWGETNHALSIIPTPCTDTKFAGDQTGVGVAYNGVRKLWFQFKAPTATTVSTEQSIAVTITAQAS